MRAALALTVGLVAGSVLGQAAPAAWATFRAQAAASTTIGADTLAPPTGVTVSAPACSGTSYSAVVRWTASSSSWLTGYEVQVAPPGGPYSVVPASGDPTATSRTLTGLARRTTYSVVVSSTGRTWRASASAVSVATGSRAC